MIIILLLPSFSNISFADSSNTIIYVDDDGTADYIRIQDAIDNSSDGDTVFVYNGVYYENITIDKSIRLIGEDKTQTIIDGASNQNVILILEKLIEITEFQIRGSKSGIKIQSTNKTIIRDNIIMTNRVGINIYYSTFISILDNNFYGCGIKIEECFIEHCSSHDIKNNYIDNKQITYYNNENNITVPINSGQVIITNCTRVNIKNVIIKGTKTGIFVCHSSYVNISFNTLINNIKSIHIGRSSYISISNNNIENSNLGIYIWASSDNIIRQNFLANLTSVDPIGIWIFASKHNEINNNIVGNPNNMEFIKAIYLHNSNKNNIYRNNLMVEEKSVVILFSTNNRISENNMKHARFYVEKNFRKKNGNNTWINNYWQEHDKKLPKVINGHLGVLQWQQYYYKKYPWINIDWFPASRPFNLSILEIHYE